MKYKFIKKILLMKLMLLILILTSTLVISMSDSEIERITKQIKPLLNEQTPTFKNIKTTVYHTVSSTDFSEWRTKSEKDYDVSTSLGWCVIPQSQRGFFEDIKCQGSGVHENRVYHTDTIKETPEQSQPLDPKFTTGRTATSTNPKPKWTVAVNNKPGTPCYIPYGTILYIDFGPDNPWSGLYRAEDTGSAFRGECKIDVYAGVGLKASKEAEKHVSGKTPEVYVLEPVSTMENLYMSSDELAEKYKFVSSNEYAARHGSITMSDKYVPGLNEENQVGELVLPYSTKKTLLGLKNFYDSVKEFSNEVLTTCENKPYEEKEMCAYMVANKYQEKIMLQQNSEEIPLPILKETLKQNQTISIAGTITSLNLDKNPYVIIKQIKGEELKINLIQQDFLFDYVKRNIEDILNQHIEITNIKVKNNTPLVLGITKDSKLEMYDEEKLNVLNMHEIALKASDCLDNKNNCLCEINITKTIKDFILLENALLQENEQIKINTLFYAQNRSVKNSIEPIQNTITLSMLTSIKGEELQYIPMIRKGTTQILFKKINNGLILIRENNEPELPRCELNKKHITFHAKQILGNSYFEKNFFPEMSFSLKI